MFELLGGRKFVSCVIALAISVIFFAVGKIDQSGFVDLLKWVVVVYIGGNVVADIATRIHRPGDPPTA